MKLSTYRALFLAGVLGLLRQARAHLDGSECSPALSFRAAQAIEQHVFTWAATNFGIKAPDQLPQDCDLLPWRDMHFEHNSLRDVEIPGRNTVRCKRCNKIFKSAHYLDRHIADRHLVSSSSSTPSLEREQQEKNTVCLAKFCAFLPCGGPGVTEAPVVNMLSNHPERQRVRHLCRQVFAKCFPPSISADFKRAHRFFEEHFCDGKKELKATKPGFSLTIILTWIIVLCVVLFYIYYFCVSSLLAPQAVTSVRGLGVKRSPVKESNPDLAKATPIRRKNVGLGGHDGRNVESVTFSVDSGPV